MNVRFLGNNSWQRYDREGGAKRTFEIIQIPLTKLITTGPKIVRNYVRNRICKVQ